MNTPKTTAKDFFLWAGAIVAFYWSIVAYTTLVFDYINYALPNALSYYPADPYQSGISFEMASVIILFPVFLILMKFIERDIVQDPSRTELWVRRWALILTLFVAGIAMVTDLIILLTTFLNGEALTLSFILKVLVILFVAGGVFMHFIADLRGYWQAFPKRRRAIRIAVAILAVVTIIAGFFIVGTPREARLARYDTEKVNGLQNIQSEITSYYQAKQKLPSTLNDLSNSLSYGPLPVDIQTGDAYSYEVVGELSFKLCADFNKESRTTPGMTANYYSDKGVGQQDNWQHGIGKVCFDRTIDPSFYPPLSR